ncbi:hypothetical protein J31TS4_19130 [Paenibacillus sp. J31TS4]|uniref:hypothetical protein n=1 Tax=Paenibacillus sp. J31TS4 TaxID=2807195 RepID=UPI001B045372|nr:hypothetical protein [Paenibacillus sp. J31TS4]GIP38633.1 hypothetical protein J31TS4_19130 [Paenibacillus sp. J31TS4]
MQWSETTPLSPVNLNDLENRISQATQNVENAKTPISQAISDMGQAAAAADSFATLAAKIRNISKDANAATQELIAGKTAYVGGKKIVGTMPNRGGQTITDNAANTANITQVSGFGLWGDGYGGSLYFKPGVTGFIDANTIFRQEVYGLNPDVVKAGQTIGANSASGAGSGFVKGTFTSDANLEAQYVVEGFSGYAKGQKVSGTLPNRNNEVPVDLWMSWDPGDGSGRRLYAKPPRGYYAGNYAGGWNSVYNTYLPGQPDWKPENILQGKSIYGIAGTTIPHVYAAEGSDETFYGSSTTYVIARRFRIDAPGTNTYTISWVMFGANGIGDVRINGQTYPNTWFKSNEYSNVTCSMNWNLTEGDIVDIVVRVEYSSSRVSLWGSKITNASPSSPRFITRDKSKEGTASG